MHNRPHTQRKLDRILLAIPNHSGTVPTRFFWSCWNMYIPRGVEILFPHPTSKFDLPTTRNYFMALALEKKCDSIMFIDDDDPVPPDTLIKLYNAKRKIIGGLCTLKRRSETDVALPTMYRRIKPLFDYSKGCLEVIETFNLDDIIQVDATGFGCILIKTEVLKAIQKKYGDKEKVFCEVPTQFVGEDISFCDRARECGFKIYVDTSLWIEHMGIAVSTLGDYLRMKYLKMANYEEGDKTHPHDSDFEKKVCAFDFKKATLKKTVKLKDPNKEGESKNGVKESKHRTKAKV